MNFHKLIDNIIKTDKSKTLWKNSNASLELIKVEFNPNYPCQPETIVEAEFICSLDLEDKMKEFSKTLKWLEKHKEIIEINTDINIQHIQMIDSDYPKIYKANFIVSFKI